MNRLGRLPDDSRSTAYGDRIPSQNSLYDWSPAHEADDEVSFSNVPGAMLHTHTYTCSLRLAGRARPGPCRAAPRAAEHEPRFTAHAGAFAG